jgi:hypothetical protein
MYNTLGGYNSLASNSIDVTSTLGLIDYTSNNATVTLTAGVVLIVESQSSAQYSAQHPSVLLTPEPLGIVSTVCFNGSLGNTEFNGTIQKPSFNGNLKELTFNGTIQTSCNTGTIKTN